MHFTPAYLERAELRDGTRVVLRQVTPDDKQLLRAGFDRLSPESRYARFLAPKQSLSDDELRYLTELDHVRHFALGALLDVDPEDPSGAIGLGIARFIQLAEPAATAEAAIAVADDMHGRGLGKLLFVRLCAAAAERGIAQFRCEVLGSNTGMAALLAKIAPERTIEVSEGVMTIDLAIPGVVPTAAVADPPPGGSMYRLFRAAAENAVEWTAAVRKLWRG